MRNKMWSVGIKFKFQGGVSTTQLKYLWNIYAHVELVFMPKASQ